MPDSGGFGRHRGGNGVTLAYVVHGVPYAIFTATTKESKFPTHTGLFGGYSETVVPAIRVIGTDAIAAMKEGRIALPGTDVELVQSNPFGGEIVLEHQARPARVVHRGEIICSSTQGGGGYGDVLERPPAAVADDVRTGALTAATAGRIYKVVLDPETLEVDPAATDAARAEERRARLARAKPFAAFLAEWLELRPHPQALKFFGSWPDAKPNREVVRI
jgi:acetophenone carboxylase